ncbi:MAG TPA: VOC family protein, partial [Actinomycetota bacterium]
MTERTEYAPGAFCWVDLSTDDLEGAARFYGQLLGWQAEIEPGAGGGSYAVFLIAGRRAAGGFHGKRIEWLSYVSVEDVDASAARADDLGADVIAGPRDVDGLGRVAYLADPMGARFGVWQPGSTHGAEVVNVPGALTWNDLVCEGLETAQGFYGELFGWTFQDAPGDPVAYSVILNGERSNGGIMVVPETPAHWRPYFVVGGADAAAARIGELGGR